MKNRNIVKTVITGIFAISLASCENFLDRPTEDNYNVDNFYKNDEQCIQGVNYLYNSPWYDFQRGFIKIGEVMSGNMYWTGPYLTFTTNATDEDLINMSYSLWAVNGHVNTVVDNILKSDGPSQAIKNQCIGEALTLKALAYFFMVRTFGEVPIIHNNTDLLTSGEYNSVYKATRANVYEYIIMTLEKAMSLLPKKTSDWNNRIDYYAAEGLLAKVYLTKAGVSGQINNDDIQKAADYAEDVILHSGRTLTPVYSDVFRLAPSTYNQTGEPMISWMWSAGRDPWTQQNTLQSDLGMVGFSETGDLWGGWGGPSIDLMDAFGADPFVSPQERKNTDYDSRRKATIMMAGDVYEYFWTDKGGFDFLRFIYDASYGVGYETGTFQGPCGGQNVKHLYGDTYDHQQATGLTPANMCYQLPTHILRLSDIYLVYAEASWFTGDTDTALEYVNKVRERAYGSNYEAHGKLTSITWEDIWKERRLELAGEGDRWYDFVRRSYYDMDGTIAEIKAQRRNNVYSYGDPCEHYFETGFDAATGKWDTSAAEWNIDPDVTKYNEDVSIPNVTATSFTLPFPNMDVVFNGHLRDEAVEVDVRATYKYDF